MIGLVAISCKPIYQTQYIHQIDSIYRDRIDSVFIKEYQKGDTIFLEKEKFVYEVKEHYKIDTIRDTIPIRTTKYINRTQKVKQKGWKGYLWGFGSALFLMIGLFIYKRFR